MSWSVRYAASARKDIKRLYDFLLQHDAVVAERALAAIIKAVDLLGDFPFAYRKADPDNPLLRELLVSFGASGYALLYHIDDDHTLTILAVRHQREDDYY